MNTNLQKLSAILSELRNASMQIKGDDVKNLMDKYNMLFLGEKFNCINSIELLHSLKKVFQFEISEDELNALIPVVCKSLNMDFEAMQSLSDLETATSSANCYTITLW